MCRHISYLGKPLSLADLLIAPAFGLFRQSWAPRQQQYGTINADGFGVGWYAEDDAFPARYRRAVPIWADRSFADVARVSRSHCILAAVRSATETMPPDESAAAPFTAGPWLFSHNGRVNGWPSSVEHLAAGLPASRLLEMEAPVDSALLWALVLERLERGEEPGNALGHTVADACAAAGGRYNFLLTDGKQIAATAAGDTLYWRHCSRTSKHSCTSCHSRDTGSSPFWAAPSETSNPANVQRSWPGSTICSAAAAAHCCSVPTW